MATLEGTAITNGSLNRTQLLKWTVYSLLLLNWGYYAWDEWVIASHTLRHGGSFLDWTAAFATTIDEAAWFGLLFMFELETYVLSWEAVERRRLKLSLHLFRVVCYLFLAHTVYARITDLNAWQEIRPASGVVSLCELADGEYSFGENYRYEDITPENCRTLAQDEGRYFIEPSVVTDAHGHRLEGWVRLIDLNDAVVWLLVIWSIELGIWLAKREITGGALVVVSHVAKFFYLVLFAHAAWWAWLDHWVYAWDQFLWIAGFWAIEKNLADWRWEIREDYPSG